MIHSFAHQLYQLLGYWELGFCNAKVLTYCNTMNTLQPNESFETSEASWRIKATSTASLMEDSNLRYKMFTSQKNSDSQVEGLVLRLVLGQVRAVRLVHVLVAALRFKIQSNENQLKVGSKSMFIIFFFFFTLVSFLYPFTCDISNNVICGCSPMITFLLCQISINTPENCVTHSHKTHADEDIFIIYLTLDAISMAPYVA